MASRQTQWSCRQWALMQNPLSSLSETSSAPTNNYNNETLGGDTKLKYLCENKAVVAAASYMPSATQEHSHMSAEKSCCRMLISLLRASSVEHHPWTSECTPCPSVTASPFFCIVCTLAFVVQNRFINTNSVQNLSF